MFPLMVHDEMVTEPPKTKTPPPPAAVFPLIVHDEMVTAPSPTATPPPYKQREKRESPMGAMGSFQGLCGTYPL